ncbi:MAG: sulfatase [Lunatimonas sp.]|uniref:sulfatase family protein n=1 Tax=Lunatimonas sp. TaxID=2060141 RepID=UPI00263B91FE|nr:sulfatase [Lunatimonas sp.]MCC5939305.1 sulfatase [Lunatimonas sp.]
MVYIRSIESVFTPHASLRAAVWLLVSFIVLGACTSQPASENRSYLLAEGKRPNILFVISDDQSYPHASVYGEDWVQTPAFDRIAKEGVLFTQAYTASPGCSPSRAAILTGLNCWQLEDAGTHASAFPNQYKVYPDVLETLGYHVGFTQKGWGPGNWEISGRTRNPAGKPYQSQKLTALTSGISQNDYAANFLDFLEDRQEDQPFCFWFGPAEPHRVFEEGSGLASGKDPFAVNVPGFLPDTPEIRSDLLDYALEIEWYDQHLGKMLAHLEAIGELDNTLIVVTSDNGMAFPRAKANMYEHGIHVPLAIRWGNWVKPGRVDEGLVSLIDLAPTFLEAAMGEEFKEYQAENPVEGRSLIGRLLNKGLSTQQDPTRAVFSSRERHSSSRWNNVGYPQRAMRIGNFLYIRNFKPERWPAGAPQKFEADGSLGPEHGGYHDIDACPTLDFLIDNRDDPEFGFYFYLAVDRRPEEEFFDVAKDPYCLQNLAVDPAFKKELEKARTDMEFYLRETGDPRMTAEGEVFESYIRYSPIRTFPEPDWAKHPTSFDLKPN